MIFKRIKQLICALVVLLLMFGCAQKEDNLNFNSLRKEIQEANPAKIALLSKDLTLSNFEQYLILDQEQWLKDNEKLIENWRKESEESKIKIENVIQSQKNFYDSTKADLNEMLGQFNVRVLKDNLPEISSYLYRITLLTDPPQFLSFYADNIIAVNDGVKFWFYQIEKGQEELIKTFFKNVFTQ